MSSSSESSIRIFDLLISSLTMYFFIRLFVAANTMWAIITLVTSGALAIAALASARPWRTRFWGAALITCSIYFIMAIWQSYQQNP